MRRIFFIALIISLLFLSLISIFFHSQPNVLGSQRDQKKITVNDQTFTVDVADTDNKRVQGLSGRKNLKQNEGMLFIFPDKSIRAFWMKDMNFPLDIIWIDSDTIVGFVENAPPEGANPINRYYSPVPVDKILELNAGTVKNLHIEKGQKIIIY